MPLGNLHQLPSLVEEIEDGCFNEMDKLKAIVVAPESKFYSLIENNKIMIQNNDKKRNSNLKSIEFEANSKLKKIDKEVFFGTKIESIIFQMNVNQINESVFSQCKSIKIIKFEENFNIININKNAFSGTSFEEIIIPKKVVRIEENAFYKCSSLKNVIFEEKSKLKYIGKNAFSGSMCPPKGSLKDGCAIRMSYA